MGRAALRGLAAVVAAAAVAGTSGAARAQLRTCVNVEAPAANADAITRLVRTEIDRHPTHRAATTDCETYLSIEVIDLGAQGGQWVTGRIGTQVPQRERIGGDGIAPAIERLLTVVLHNDPLVLRGPESGGWLIRQERELQLRSRMRIGVEAYEIGAWVAGGLATLPGVAISARREVSTLYIGLRLGGALDPAARPDALHLQAQLDAQLEAALYARPSAAVSLFAGVLVGAVYQRFEGPAPLDGVGATGVATTMGLSLAVRAGVETLRFADVHLLAFLELEAPAFVSRDPDQGIVNQWVPSSALGVGVLF
jgi:hypothetical protein